MSAPAWLIRRLRIIVKDPARALAIPSTATDPYPPTLTAARRLSWSRQTGGKGTVSPKGIFFFFLNQQGQPSPEGQASFPTCLPSPLLGWNHTPRPKPVTGQEKDIHPF